MEMARVCVPNVSWLTAQDSRMQDYRGRRRFGYLKENMEKKHG